MNKRFFNTCSILLQRKSDLELIAKSMILSPPTNKGNLEFETLSGRLEDGLNRYELDFLEACQVFQIFDKLNTIPKFDRAIAPTGWMCFAEQREYLIDFTKRAKTTYSLQFKFHDFVTNHSLLPNQAKKALLILDDKYCSLTASVRLDGDPDRIKQELNSLIEECKQGDMFEDLKLDLRHVKPAKHPSLYDFPSQWLKQPE